MLNEARVAVSAAQLQFSAPFSETEQSAFAPAVMLAYHNSGPGERDMGPIVRDVCIALHQVAPKQKRLLTLLGLPCNS